MIVTSSSNGANGGTTASIISVASTAALALLVASISMSSPLSSLWCDAKEIIDKSSNTTDNAKDSNGLVIDIYDKLQVRPPHNSTKLIKLPFGVQLPLARWSWKVHGKLLPLLHFFETGRPDDVFVNLRVLWCKLLISLDPRSPAYEGNPEHSQRYATYRMLPPISIKWALRHLNLWRVFPRWMHANIELRIVYLQSALERVLTQKQDALQKDGELPDVCVIVLGGGYDPRGAKLLAEYNNIGCVYELDLPEVVDSKRKLLLRAGFDVVVEENDKENSPKHNVNHGVRLEGVDLNDNDGVDRVLDKIRDELLAQSKDDPSLEWRVLLISEALLLYLDPGKAEHILKGVSKRFGGYHNESPGFRGAAFVFADRLMKHTEGTNQQQNDATAGSKRSRRSMALPATQAEIE